MAMFHRAILGFAITCVVLAVVRATSDNLLRVPLLEVGSLWFRALREFWENVKSHIFHTPDFSSPWTYLVLAVGTVGLYYMYQILFVPLNRIRMLGDLGYAPDNKSLSQKDMVNIVRKRRMVGEVPPVYPNGWFAVLESRDLKIAQSKAVSCLGLNLAVFRGEDGRAHVLDGYCPHMGAHLGVGGQVCGSCIECPFHGWQFRGDDGKVVKIPYADDNCIPDIAKVTSYTVQEKNGFIYMWFHAEGKEPYWEIPVIDEIASGQWAYRGRTEHIINAHIEEVPENGADVAHLGQVHGPFMTTGIDLRYTYSKLWSFARHHWVGTWTAGTGDQSHVGTLSLTHGIKFFGMRIPILDMNVEARQVGPGCVQMLYNHHIVGSGCFYQTLTPVEPTMQKCYHHIYHTKWCPPFVPKMFLFSESIMIERDIMIWNNKTYIIRPLFVKSKEDALVAKHRRWYSQFYSEHSPRVKFQKDTLDW